MKWVTLLVFARVDWLGDEATIPDGLSCSPSLASENIWMVPLSL